MNNEDPLRCIVGRQLLSVEFVQDYLQLAFEGARLTAYELPKFTSRTANFTTDMPGYVDAMVDLIGHVVTGTRVVPDEELRVDFDNGSSIVISFREIVPYEYAMFQDGEHLEVW